VIQQAQQAANQAQQAAEQAQAQLCCICPIRPFLQQICKHQLL
jgi:hypothetical protein